MPSGKGEAHVAVLLADVFARCHRVVGCDLFDISDNQSAVVIFAMGRAKPWSLNTESRERCATEGAWDVRIASTWSDTHHMTADAGTRPNKLGSPSDCKTIWLCARLVIEIFVATACITSQAKLRGLSVSPPWEVKYGSI